MTTRRTFFGWLAGAAAAPSVARDALANTGGFAHGGVVRNLGHYTAGSVRKLDPAEMLSPEITGQITRAVGAWAAQANFRLSRPPTFHAPHHYIRAPAPYLRGLPEHVARQKRLKHRA